VMPEISLLSLRDALRSRVRDRPLFRAHFPRDRPFHPNKEAIRDPGRHTAILLPWEAACRPIWHTPAHRPSQRIRPGGFLFLREGDRLSNASENVRNAWAGSPNPGGTNKTVHS